MTRLSQYALRALGLLVVLFVLFYIGDYLSVRIRMLHPTRSDPFETLTRTRVLAIPQKNGRVEYQIDALKPTESVTCVHSIFPHFGDPPCWRIKPHFNEPIPMQFLLYLPQPVSK